MASYLSFVIFFAVFLLLSYRTSGVLRPRGVSLLSKMFYDPSQKFHCLDGSGLFPFHFVNDDFCDCIDGSDEPGTSACPNGTFTCVNHGHEPVTLPSSRVNDGICDCCDSSDEYNSPADCFNHCKELGEQVAAAARIMYDKFKKGHEIREMYVKMGKEKKEEYMKLLDDLQKQEQEVLKVKLEKQDAKENAETKENLILSKEREFRKAQEKQIAAEKQMLQENQLKEEENAKNAFEELDLNKDGKLTLSEVQSFSRFDYDGDGKVSENEAQFYMQKKNEVTLSDFLSNGWKVMKSAFTINEIDEPPKSAVSEKDEKTVSSYPATNEGEKVEGLKINEAEKQNILKEAAMSRKDFADADKLLRDIQAEIWLLKRKLKSDFGNDDEFLVLETQCFDFSEKKYLYKVCPFDRVVQIVKVNKDETLIGLWDRWSGPEENHYEQMRFSRGTACWNGPSRSAEVNLKCGIENKVTSVVESSPCIYEFEFISPALCKDLPESVSKALNNEIIFI